MRTIALAVVAPLLLVLAMAATGEESVDALRNTFRKPPANARIMMRWWWFGAAVTDSELAREMRVMRDAGIGGVEIQPVYRLQSLQLLRC